MCATCGCSTEAGAKLTDTQSGVTVDLAEEKIEHAHPHEHHHDHPHDHQHEYDHPHSHGTVVSLEKEVLARNNLLAERNRGWLAGRGVLALNLVSSPGAGKTTLLEKTIRDLSPQLTLSVIEGDQESDNDARRIQATGCRVVQINTGTGCHLDAAMVGRGLKQLDPPPHSIVLIENVGNLVCPAMFDLGELAKVLIVSVTEGEDKPVKYPHMFRAAEVLILNKIDLAPHVSFDEGRFLDSVRQVNPRLEMLKTSATRGDGLTDWYVWLQAHAAGSERDAQEGMVQGAGGGE